MANRPLIARTATNALSILWEEGYFQDWRKRSDIENKIAKRGNNFSGPELGMALKGSWKLTRRGKRGAYEYIQKYPFAAEDEARIPGKSRRKTTMKIFVRVTDDDVATFEGHADLMQLPKAGATSKNTKIKPAKPRRFTEITFSLNERAFMKKYTKEMSGSQKFTLLLARLVEGKVGQEISGRLNSFGVEPNEECVRRKV